MNELYSNISYNIKINILDFVMVTKLLCFVVLESRRIWLHSDVIRRLVRIVYKTARTMKVDYTHSTDAKESKVGKTEKW